MICEKSSRLLKRLPGREFYCFPFFIKQEMMQYICCFTKSVSEQFIHPVSFHSITFSSQLSEVFHCGQYDHMPALHSRKSQLILSDWKSHQIVSWKLWNHRLTAAWGSWFRAHCPRRWHKMTLCWQTQESDKKPFSDEKETQLTHTCTYKHKDAESPQMTNERGGCSISDVVSFICKWAHRLSRHAGSLLRSQTMEQTSYQIRQDARRDDWERREAKRFMTGQDTGRWNELRWWGLRGAHISGK